MSIENAVLYRKIQKDNKNNPTRLILSEFYNECKIFSYKEKRKRWITFYDIETVFKVVLTGSEISEFTTEILVRLKLSIENVQNKFKSKSMPLKALKILIDSARKSIVI